MPQGPIDLDLVACIHDIALGRAVWEEALEGLRGEFATDTSVLIVLGQRPEDARRLSQTREGDFSWTEYATRFAAIDPYAEAMRRRARELEGLIVRGEDVVPPKALCASEFYNEWFRPHGVLYTAGGLIRIGPGRLLQLAMPRSLQAGPYRDEELYRLQRYFNHIRRAVVIAEILEGRCGEPDFDRFARRHGLTGAEVRLLESLVREGSLKSAAAQLRRSYYTLRSQLRAVFEKTETHSQVELIRLVLGPAGSADSPVGAVSDPETC